MQTARYDPWFYTAKCLIDEGAIGDIRLLSARKSYRLGQRAPFFRERALHGGLIPWVAIHGIDFIRYLCTRTPHSRCSRVTRRCRVGISVIWKSPHS